MRIRLWLAAFIIFFFIWVRYIERHSIYFPMKEITVTPRAIGLPYEEVYFETSDNKKLCGWFISGDKTEPTIIFCHGNAGNISHRLEKIAVFHDLGFNIFIFDYRGYGKSEGGPSESGLYKDARAAYDYLTVKMGIPAGDIILYGESIGGVVAADLASVKNVKALITEEAFTSTRDMARIHYPFIPRFLIASKFDSISKIKNVTCPKLIIHSVDDEIVPFSLGEKLFNQASAPKKFLKIRGSHNTAFFDSKEEVAGGMRSFLKEISK